MREIKFRGKRTDNGEWVYGNLIYSSDAVKEYEAIIVPQKDADGFTTDYASNGENKESYGFDNWFCVIPETVGQSTGLHDKNGKEIYEGDIVYTTYPHCHAIVTWDTTRFIGYTIEYESKIIYVDRIDKNNKSALEVIGNIHSNPELLESEE